jgi:hypothetical protein
LTRTTVVRLPIRRLHYATGISTQAVRMRPRHPTAKTTAPQRRAARHSRIQFIFGRHRHSCLWPCSCVRISHSHSRLCWPQPGHTARPSRFRNQGNGPPSPLRIPLPVSRSALR